jgi:hypothetical protein
MLKISTPLADAILAVGFATAMDGFQVHFFSGTVPASANASTGSSVKLATFTVDNDGSTGATWDTSAIADGVIPKTASEALEAEGLAGGTPTYFRICAMSDDGESAVTTEARVQGTIGPNGTYDLVRSPNSAISVSDPLTLPVVTIQLPLGN